MPTEADMKDTAVYKNKTYGFCSPLCKDEFKKNPEKYVQK
jgi:YHS domain-containing protein